MKKSSRSQKYVQKKLSNLNKQKHSEEQKKIQQETSLEVSTTTKTPLKEVLDVLQHLQSQDTTLVRFGMEFNKLYKQKFVPYAIDHYPDFCESIIITRNRRTMLPLLQALPNDVIQIKGRGHNARITCLIPLSTIDRHKDPEGFLIETAPVVDLSDNTWTVDPEQEWE